MKAKLQIIEETNGLGEKVYYPRIVFDWFIRIIKYIDYYCHDVDRYDDSDNDEYPYLTWFGYKKTVYETQEDATAAGLKYFNNMYNDKMKRVTDKKIVDEREF